VHGYAIATPRPDPSLGEAAFLDFTSGYVVRALDTLPKQGSRRPWKVYQNYLQDALTLRFAKIDDGVLQLERSPSRQADPSPARLYLNPAGASMPE
jgi:monooxygenase